MAENQSLTFDRERRGFRPLGVAMLAAASLALEACGSDNKPVATPTPDTAGRYEPGKDHQLVFDSLGGDSSIIQVYPNPKRKIEHNGTFNDDGVVGAECKTEGRMVHSDPKAGEEPRKSEEWIKIDGSPGQVQYATAVYVKDPAKLLRELPEC
jgi:hypothetical protein